LPPSLLLSLLLLLLILLLLWAVTVSAATAATVGVGIRAGVGGRRAMDDGQWAMGDGRRVTEWLWVAL